MSRDAAVRVAIPRALPHPVELGARYGAAFDSVDPLGNSDAVRLLACGESESAFEYPDESSACRGAFTESLLEVLNDVGESGGG